jgi:hypothetical protein
VDIRTDVGILLQISDGGVRMLDILLTLGSICILGATVFIIFYGIGDCYSSKTGEKHSVAGRLLTGVKTFFEVAGVFILGFLLFCLPFLAAGYLAGAFNGG